MTQQTNLQLISDKQPQHNSEGNEQLIKRLRRIEGQVRGIQQLSLIHI